MHSDHLVRFLDKHSISIDHRQCREITDNGLVYVELMNFNTVHAIGRSRVGAWNRLGRKYRDYLAKAMVHEYCYVAGVECIITWLPQSVEAKASVTYQFRGFRYPLGAHLCGQPRTITALVAAPA